LNLLRATIGLTLVAGVGLLLCIAQPDLAAQQKEKKKVVKEEMVYPPKLPGGKQHVVDTSDDFLKSTADLLPDVKIAKTAPTIEFMYLPGQDYKGNPWSAWGDSTFANGKYYTAFGDHLAPGGNAYIYEYDPEKKSFRQLCDIRKVLNLQEGMYTPGKVHTTLTVASDGWIYFGTHRGSTTVTSKAPGYKGDWIIRCHPETGKAEVVVEGPVARHCIPTGFLDPQRLIFYAGTAPPTADKDAKVHFFAYDVKNRKMLCDVEDGPARAMVFSKSNGRVWYNQSSGGSLMRYDPIKGGDPIKIEGDIGIRAATDETPNGIVYTVSQGNKKGESGSDLYAFNVKTETIEKIGPMEVGTSLYITSLDIDPTGRYIYYVPGAHGGAERDGSPVVQFDLKTKTKKVLAFLHPFYKEKYGAIPSGSYSVALSDKGDKLFITWNTNRSTAKVWECMAMTVLNIPEAERVP